MTDNYSMTLKDILKAIKKAKRVYVFVPCTLDNKGMVCDSIHLRVQKPEASRMLRTYYENLGEEQRIKARTDADGSLWIG